MFRRCLLFILVLSSMSSAGATEKLKLLIVDGQNNHAWAKTTPVMQK